MHKSLKKPTAKKSIEEEAETISLEDKLNFEGFKKKVQQVDFMKGSPTMPIKSQIKKEGYCLKLYTKFVEEAK